ETPRDRLRSGHPRTPVVASRSAGRRSARGGDVAGRRQGRERPAAAVRGDQRARPRPRRPRPRGRTRDGVARGCGRALPGRALVLLRGTKSGPDEGYLSRILLLASTTGYHTRAFGDAATRVGVVLVFATDRCHVLVDPWQDGAEQAGDAGGVARRRPAGAMVSRLANRRESARPRRQAVVSVRHQAGRAV